MRHCRGCARLFPVEELGDRCRCRTCDPVFGLQRGMHDNYHGYRLFLNYPARLARIERYAARAELNLPLFDG